MADPKHFRVWTCDLSSLEDCKNGIRDEGYDITRQERIKQTDGCLFYVLHATLNVELYHDKNQTKINFGDKRTKGEA